MMCQRYMPKRCWLWYRPSGLITCGRPEYGEQNDAVLSLRMLEVPRAAEIILGARAADGREVLVAVHVRT